jgi:hypothetical protein
MENGSASRLCGYVFIPFRSFDPPDVSNEFKILLQLGVHGQTVGLLQRRHVKINQIKCIGKESNSLENVEEGLVHSEQSVYTEYA